MLHFSVKVGEVAGKAIRQPGYATTGRTASTRHDVTAKLCGSKSGYSTTSRAAFKAATVRCPVCESKMPH